MRVITFEKSQRPEQELSTPSSIQHFITFSTAVTSDVWINDLKTKGNLLLPNVNLYENILFCFWIFVSSIISMLTVYALYFWKSTLLIYANSIRFAIYIIFTRRVCIRQFFKIGDQGKKYKKLNSTIPRTCIVDKFPMRGKFLGIYLLKHST